MTPSLSAIATHFDTHGGLWLVVPAGPHRPLFACLGVATVGKSVMATYEGGDLAATIEENPVLQGATWTPVDCKGKPTT